MISDLDPISPASAELLRSSAPVVPAAATNREEAGENSLAPAPLGARLPGVAAVVEGQRRTGWLAAYDAIQDAECAEGRPVLSCCRAAHALGLPQVKLWRLLKRRREGKSLTPDF